ncbi:MAG: hypothetical protein MJ252_28565, partial [archaeon]|nr:hypothetical protein [archaeon]
QMKKEEENRKREEEIKRKREEELRKKSQMEEDKKMKKENEAGRKQLLFKSSVVVKGSSNSGNHDANRQPQRRPNLEQPRPNRENMHRSVMDNDHMELEPVNNRNNQNRRRVEPIDVNIRYDPNDPTNPINQPLMESGTNFYNKKKAEAEEEQKRKLDKMIEKLDRDFNVKSRYEDEDIINAIISSNYDETKAMEILINKDYAHL